MRYVFLLLSFGLACGTAEQNRQETNKNALSENHNWEEEAVIRFLILCRQNAAEDGYEDPYEHCNCFFNSISAVYPNGVDFEDITAGDLREARADCFDY